MEKSEESLHSCNDILDEKSQNESEPEINKLMEENTNDYSCTSVETNLQKNELCTLLSSDQNKSADLDKIEIVNVVNEMLNETSVRENEYVTQLESTPNPKNVSDSKNIHGTFNESAISSNSSTDEDVFQSRDPVQNDISKDVSNSPESPASTVRISDKESIIESDSEIKKRPIIIQAKVCYGEKSGSYKTNDSKFEVNKEAEISQHQEASKDIISHNSLSVEADNSNTETESSYMQSSIKNNSKDVRLDEKEGGNEILSEKIMQKMSKRILNQKTEGKSISLYGINEDFFNGLFDISAFKPAKHSTMIKGDKTIKYSKQLMKNKHSSHTEKKDSGNVHENINRRKCENEILPQEVIQTLTNKTTLNQKNVQEANNTPSDSIIQNSFNESFDINAFKPEKNSTMIEDQNKDSPHTEKKYSGNIVENMNEKKCNNEILSQDVMQTLINKTTLNQKNIPENNISTQSIIEDFFSGSFDINAFKPKKNSTIIKRDNPYTNQNQLRKNPHTEKKYSRNVPKNIKNKKMHSSLNNNKSEHKRLNKNNKLLTDTTDNSNIHLKRKISEKRTDNSKKITKKNKKDEAINITADILNKYTLNSKRGPEDSKVKNKSNKRINNELQYNDKDIILNNFDTKEENTKRNKRKNVPRTKIKKNEEIFKEISHKVTPLKMSRNLRNSSLVASKKIKEIEKLENANSIEEIALESDKESSHYSVKTVDDSFKSIFKDRKNTQKYKVESKLENDKFYNEDTKDITSLDIFQACFENEGKTEDNRITRNNRKRKGTLDACNISAKRQLRIDNITSKGNFFSDISKLELLLDENEDAYENHHSNKKKADKRRQSKNNKRAESKLLECEKNADKIIPCKSDAVNIMHYGAITRSKRKTWDMLEQELLGKSNGGSLSNNVTKTVLLKERAITKQNVKDADVYSISGKSVLHIMNVPVKRNKNYGKFEKPNTENKHFQTSTNNTQSSEIVPYKSKSILEKAIAAMEKCTEKFITPEKCYAEKEWIHDELELDEMNIDQEAEFHSNMTLLSNKNEQYYKNEIVAILKQSSSKKNESSGISTTKTMYSDGEYNYDFNDAEHLVKRSIITESYSVKENTEKNPRSENLSLISASNKKENDSWSRLMKELNLEENKSKDILKRKPSKSRIYHENVEEHINTDLKRDRRMQLAINLNERKFYKQNEIENKQKYLKYSTFEETPVESKRVAANIKNNCTTKDTKSRINNTNAELNTACTKEKMFKNIESKEKQTLKNNNIEKSPKYKVQVEEGGSVKFKRCNRSLSSSSEDSEKQRNAKFHDKKLPKNQQTTKKKYKKYLNNLFKKEDSLSKEKLEKDTRVLENKARETTSKNIPTKDKYIEQRKMINLIIAKNDDDVFSISSSDSETANKGSGLLCDFFDE